MNRPVLMFSLSLIACFSERGDIESVRSVFIRKKCSLAFAERHCFCARGILRMLSQKPLPVLFIFSFVDRTGRIDQLPARFHIAGGGIKYRILYLRKSFKLFRGLVTQVGLFRDDSEPRAWDVTQHPVGFPDEFLPDFSTVLDGDRYYADSEPLRPFSTRDSLLS